MTVSTIQCSFVAGGHCALLVGQVPPARGRPDVLDADRLVGGSHRGETDDVERIAGHTFGGAHELVDRVALRERLALELVCRRGSPLDTGLG